MGVREVFCSETLMEYTILAVTATVAVVAIDLILKTKVTMRSTFWVFIAVMFLFKTVVNGYLTGRPIVLYGEEFFLNIRIGTIPIEDFLFGFSLMTLSVALWEYFSGRQETTNQ